MHTPGPQPDALQDMFGGCEAVDLCAASGGKTAQLATAGARGTAFDRSTRRLDRLVAAGFSSVHNAADWRECWSG